ncbi:MAG: sulfurtransferase [Gammaproteobacteria bacterium HGW-Gammaproteobacteria-11]|nr:MAG: sulfurtransferase [Gammaproteobacteria bacterium HGW-Gammaproteobacteria-11]
MPHSDEFLSLAKAANTRITKIHPDDIKDHVKPSTLLLDVRDKEEFDQGHLEGATNLSRGKLEMRIHEVAPDKKAPIVVYCNGGNQGALAADTLQQLGYTDVVSICGGLNAVKQAQD